MCYEGYSGVNRSWSSLGSNGVFFLLILSGSDHSMASRHLGFNRSEKGSWEDTVFWRLGLLSGIVLLSMKLSFLRIQPVSSVQRH
jgi:hypothetical protein